MTGEIFIYNLKRSIRMLLLDLLHLFRNHPGYIQGRVVLDTYNYVLQRFP